jgi:hypothetical protein
MASSISIASSYSEERLRVPAFGFLPIQPASDDVLMLIGFDLDCRFAARESSSAVPRFETGSSATIVVDHELLFVEQFRPVSSIKFLLFGYQLL